VSVVPGKLTCYPNWKRGIKLHEFNLTGGSRKQRECNGDADIGRGLGSSQRWI
jgi:hypothetical protein